MSISLRHLEVFYGASGAREKSEDMMVQLIRTERPRADRIRIFKGDGGIDAHDGDLTDPAGVDVFQVKYFPGEIGESQKNQIRQSFQRVAESTKFTGRSWALCLPIDMSIDEKKRRRGCTGFSKNVGRRETMKGILAENQRDRPRSLPYNRTMDTTRTLDRLLDPVGQRLGVEAAEALVELRADAELQERMEYLARRCTEGELSAEEKAEYDAFVSANNLIAILQAKARAFLARQRKKK